MERPDESIDLGQAALTLALSEYPELDCQSYLRRLDDLAVQVSARGGADAEPFRTLAALNFVLFSEQGFRGNREAYYDAENSFLNRVIERKTGIPISLSVLYMEVAQRVGLNCVGVGFPGHFLVKTSIDNNEVVIDPFNNGEVKSAQDLDQLLRGMYGGKIGLRPEFLAAVTKKQIIERMLGNLKAIYGRSEEWMKMLGVFDRLIILNAGAVEEIRDRGAIYLRLECYAQAKIDFETYLRLAPDAKDAPAIRNQLADLAKHSVMLH